MQFKENGIGFVLDPADLTDDALTALHLEVSAAAEQRGLTLPLLADVVKVKLVDQKLELDDVKELVTNQFGFASEAYTSLVDGINTDRADDEKYEAAPEDEVRAAFDEWLTEDKLVYVQQLMEADPQLRFTLVATPNIVATFDEIKDIAQSVGDKVGIEPFVWNDLYNRYSAYQLSGADRDDGKPVRFSLMPNKPNQAFYNTALKQRQYLAERQQHYPYPEHVPSVLESVSYWMRLVTEDPMSLKDSPDNATPTYIRHFDLPEHSVGDTVAVPATYLGDDSAYPALYYNPSEGHGFARVAIH